MTFAKMGMLALIVRCSTANHAEKADVVTERDRVLLSLKQTHHPTARGELEAQIKYCVGR